MAYGYFKSDGAVMSVSANHLDYPDPEIIETEVSNLLSANSIYLDIDTMTVCERQPFNFKIALNTIHGLPTGTTITMADGQFVCNDGAVEFDADVSGAVVAFIEHPRFIAQYVEVPTGPEGDT